MMGASNGGTDVTENALGHSFGSIWPRDERLAHRMVVEIRSHPALDAALLQDDALVRKYPTIDLTLLAESPDAVDTIIRTLDLAIRPVSQAQT
jgi:hypothetical protein